MDRVRRLLPDDWASLRALRLRALGEEPEWFSSTLERELGFSPQRWQARLQPDANPHFGAFSATDDLIGLCAGAPDDHDPAVAWLLSLWVDPPFRGAGVAGALVTEVRSWASTQGFPVLRLEVTQGNDRARRLYERHGFRLTGYGVARPTDGRMELSMECRLVHSASPEPG